MRYTKDSKAVIPRKGEAAGDLCRFTGQIGSQLSATQLSAHSFHLNTRTVEALANTQHLQLCLKVSAFWTFFCFGQHTTTLPTRKKSLLVQLEGKDSAVKSVYNKYEY